ncbi:hypothetical protein C0993_003024 [Termitomyces sp. T159_Od127]|nr:hypothetical protein C0993_003024 [Termitomyces sp. T159_Od127]
MLASPLLPAAPVFPTSHVSDDAPLQYRPARDKEAFNSLLPPPVEFVEGSSSGAFAVPPGKYEPINASPKTNKPDRPEISTQPPATPATGSGASTKGKSLYSGGIDVSWPDGLNRGTGLHNNGNTCFLNSALQCLLHTPPLLRALAAHKEESCKMASKGFCMSCSMKRVMIEAHRGNRAFAPTAISNKLPIIAKHLKRGRQEDSHEFLRYAIDALQKSCLAEQSRKVDPKVAETTWVHQIFGGRLRSRVTCLSCGYNSDTFDRVLDISVDINNQQGLKDALKKFVAIDHLKGADKYKCDKCKKHVNADKRFTIDEAPLVLTIHLKRFSPLGRKIPHHVHYDEDLSLQPYMSEDRFGPMYSLYGVICHAGNGPNSGHYYAFVKSKDSRWWEMNDESVSHIGSSPHKKNAYMLFYIRRKGQALEAAVNVTQQPSQSRPSLIGSMKKRKERDEADEDIGTKVSAPFIGPLLPSPALEADGTGPKRQKMSQADPQGVFLKKKIAEVAGTKEKTSLSSLEAYASDDEDQVEDDKPETEIHRSTEEASSPPQRPNSHPPSSSPISPSTFYSTGHTKKRKNHSGDSKLRKKGSKLQNHSGGYRGAHLNPLSALGRHTSRRPRPI